MGCGEGEHESGRVTAETGTWGELRHQWYAAARSDELGHGQVLGRVVLGVRVALWRVGGRAVALLDRCLHRNARLSEGVVVEGCLACPYHGWMYDAAGRLMRVPSLGPDARTPERSLQRFPVREEGGLVWVWVGERDPDEPAMAGRRPFAMPHVGEERWGWYYMTTWFDNGVTHLVENFMDVPHTVFVHRGWFRSAAQKEVPIGVERSREGVFVTYRRPDDRIGWSDRILNPRGLPLTHTDKFYAPNHTRVDYIWGEGSPHARHFIITSTCTPETPERTLVFTLIAFNFGAALNRLARLWLPGYTRTVIEQDVRIMRNQGDNLRHFRDTHRAGERFSGTAADWLHEDIEALREWYRRPGEVEEPAPRVREAVIWV